MDIIKAYQETVDAALELRGEGIDIKITPSGSEHSAEEGGLPRDKWVQVEFFVETKAQSDAVNQRTRELNWKGIQFDGSGHPGQRQWDLDWSFQVTGIPDGDYEAAGDEVEDMIIDMEDPEDDTQKG